MSWLYLSVAVVFEIVFAMGTKLSDGFTRPLPTLMVVVGIVGGVGFLGLAAKGLPISVAYPIWTACGALGTIALGAVMLGEPLGALKLGSAALIVVGVAGLRAAS